MWIFLGIQQKWAIACVMMLIVDMYCSLLGLYLIQTKTNGLFICEFKFKRREIGNNIILEMQDKISKLKSPKGFAKIAVLFHLSGVTESVETNSYFYRIIDITDFLEIEK